MRPLIICVLFFCLLFNCKSTKVIAPTIVPQIDELANRYLQLGWFSGTILVAKQEKVFFQRSYGWANYEKQEKFREQTTFEIGSLSKLFITALFEQKNITDFSKDSSSHILGQLLEERLNLPFPKIIEQSLPPLGFQHTFAKKGNTSLAQGYLFHNYRGQGLELEAINHSDPSKYEFVSTPSDLFKLSNILSAQNFTQSGYLEQGGFSYTLKKEGDLRIIILSNRRQPVSAEMAESIYAIYKEQPYELPLLRQLVDIDPSNFQNYIGTYTTNPQIQFEVLVESDRLFTLMMGQKMRLIPQSTTQFYYLEMDAAIRFVKDSTGHFTKAILYDGFLEGQLIEKLKKIN